MMENKSMKKVVKKVVNKQTHLYLHDKIIKHIPNIESYENLSVLYLHSNNICKIENLHSATGLTSLYLQNNKISKLENLDTLKNLKKLYLNHNEISVIENLDKLTKLEELYVEKQRLNKGEALCFDPRTIKGISKSLQILNVSHNNISSISNLQPLRFVKLLNASHNKLNDVQEIINTIQHWYYLFEALFLGNPIAKKHRYRENIIARTIRLSMLDNKEVNEATRCFIKCLEREQANKATQHINLADIYPGLPKNYAHPLQKAVSSSLIKTGLSAMNICTENVEHYIPWRALPQSNTKLRKSKKRQVPKKQHGSSSSRETILQLQV